MKVKTIILYILIFMGVFVLSAFYRFPAGQVAEMLNGVVHIKNRAFQLQMDGAKPALPFGLDLVHPKVILNKDIEFLADTAEISFSPLVFFQDERPIDIRSNAYGGTIQGRLILDNFDPLIFSEARLAFSGLNVTNFRYKTGVADLTINCLLFGEAVQGPRKGVKEKNKILNQLSHGSLMVDGFTAQVEDSWLNGLNLSSIGFSKVFIEYIQEPKEVSLIKCTARGPVMNVNLKGDIEFLFPVKKTRLNLTGVIMPDSPYLAKFANQAAIRAKARNISKNGIKFYIKGTFEKPEIGI